MQISIANAILVARLIGKSIVTACLQMFLPFKTSQQLGEEILADGDFALTGTQAINTTGTYWVTDARWSIANGKATFSAVSSNKISVTNAPLTANTTVTLTFTISDSSANNARMFIGNFVGNVGYISGGYNTYTNGNHTVTFTVPSGQTSLAFWGYAPTGTFKLSNISLHEIAQFSPDETTNNNDAKLLTGNCLDFDGLNDYLDVDGFTMSGTNATFVFWVNPDAIASTNFVF